MVSKIAPTTTENNSLLVSTIVELPEQATAIQTMTSQPTTLKISTASTQRLETTQKDTTDASATAQEEITPTKESTMEQDTTTSYALETTTVEKSAATKQTTSTTETTMTVTKESATDQSTTSTTETATSQKSTMALSTTAAVFSILETTNRATEKTIQNSTAFLTTIKPLDCYLPLHPSSYAGDTSLTENGVPCQVWDSAFPHRHI